MAESEYTEQEAQEFKALQERCIVDDAPYPPELVVFLAYAYEHQDKP